MPEPTVTDEQILALIHSPQTLEQGFRHLIGKYQERLYYHIRYLVSDHEDANDVLQNTLLKVFQGIAGFEGRSSLFTWLYRIASNEAVSFLNKKKTGTLVTNDTLMEYLSNTMPATGHFDGEDLQRRLILAMQQLPDKQRQVFVMRYFESMSYKEISAILDTSEGALKASFHHAVKKIERYFHDCG
ncbi:MAG: RNA polymerase sigma factor [Saprospiraceae bacterium]|jgi:RNA polymerase sigma-70 factor (ECF subfamily)